MLPKPTIFKYGDTVRLRGGKRLMRVDRIDLETGTVSVVWWVNQATQEIAKGAFPPGELILVRRENP